MDINFEVHNVAPSEETKLVEVDGEQVTARIPIAEVELTTDDLQHGSLTLRFRGRAAEAARVTFRPGQKITWTIPEMKQAMDEGKKLEKPMPMAGQPGIQEPQTLGDQLENPLPLGHELAEQQKRDPAGAAPARDARR